MSDEKHLKSPSEAKYPKACRGKTAQIYIQATCEFSAEEKIEAQYVGVTAIFICCVIAAIYIECVKYREGLTDLEFTKWDL